MEDAGSAVTVYHGSKNEFEYFDEKSMGTGGSDGILQYGHGFYFTNKRELAEGYGLHVKKDHLTLNNPINMETVPDNLIKWMRKTFPSINNFDNYEFKMKVGTVHRILQFLQKAHYNTADVLKELGYDGIIEHHPYADTYVVFDPEQVEVLKRDSVRLDERPKGDLNSTNLRVSDIHNKHNNNAEICLRSSPRR